MSVVEVINFIKEQEETQENEEYYNPENDWMLTTYEQEIEEIKEFCNLNHHYSKFFDFTGFILDAWENSSSRGDYREYYILYKDDNIICRMEDIEDHFEWVKEKGMKYFINTCDENKILILKKY